MSTEKWDTEAFIVIGEVYKHRVTYQMYKPYYANVSENEIKLECIDNKNNHWVGTSQEYMRDFE